MSGLLFFRSRLNILYPCDPFLSGSFFFFTKMSAGPEHRYFCHRRRRYFILRPFPLNYPPSHQKVLSPLSDGKDLFNLILQPLRNVSKGPSRSPKLVYPFLFVFSWHTNSHTHTRAVSIRGNLILIILLCSPKKNLPKAYICIFELCLFLFLGIALFSAQTPHSHTVSQRSSVISLEFN